MALVTIADIKTFMDISLSLTQEDACQIVLDGLQSELETYLKRPVENQAFTETYIMPSDHVGVPMGSFFYDHDSTEIAAGASVTDHIFTEPPATVYLRNSPVTTVTTVTRTPATVGASTTTLAESSDYVVHRYGLDIYGSYANDKIVVTYNAGLAGADIKIFKLMILRAATREMQNMHDDVVGVKDLEPRNVAPMETGFLERELLAVKKYRRARVS
jgi:hypothetical protein